MLKTARIQLGLSQQALSAITGIHVNQIQKYESGACRPENMTLKNAIAISDALGIDPHDLLTEEPDK